MCSSSDDTGVTLPKLDVPNFDGNIIHWNNFWEQFGISVHGRHNVEGLSGSGDHYQKCLRKQYYRPRLIHQAHVRVVLDAPSLKDGNGKELRRLHDAINQHLRALMAMDYEPSGPFITSILELKLETNTMFVWQKDSTNVPQYTSLLEFLNLLRSEERSSIAAGLLHLHLRRRNPALEKSCCN